MSDRRRGRGRATAAGLLALMVVVVTAYVATAPVPTASADQAVASPAAPPSSTTESTTAPAPTPGDPPAAVGTVPPTVASLPPTVPATPEPSASDPPADPTAPAAGIQPPAPGEPPATAVAVQAVRQAPPVVAVLGDSLGFSASPFIDAVLRDLGVEPAMGVAPGRRIAQWGLQGQISPAIQAIAELEDREPDLWIVELGTNDINEMPLDVKAYALLVHLVLDRIGPDTPVVWMNVHRGDRPVETKAFNQVLTLVASERPQLRVVDWDAVAANQPVLTTDDVHLNDLGMGAFAGTMAAITSMALATSLDAVDA